VDRPVPERLIRLRTLRGRRRRDIERELASHLEDTRRELWLAGLPPAEAERQSLERLGDLSEIADGFERVYRRGWSTRLALAFGLAGTLLVGAYSSGAFASGASAHHGGSLSGHTHTMSSLPPHQPR
jgi:hypothetical protein